MIYGRPSQRFLLSCRAFLSACPMHVLQLSRRWLFWRGLVHLFCHRHYDFPKSVVAFLGTHTPGRGSIHRNQQPELLSERRGKPMLQSTLGWPLLTFYLMCLWPEIRKQELGKGTHVFLRTWSATRSMRLNMCLHAVLNCGHEESNGKVNRRETLWKWRKRENPPCQEQQLSAVPRRYGLTQSWLGIRKSRDWKGRPSHLHQSWKVTQKSEICNNGERLSTGHNHSQRR